MIRNTAVKIPFNLLLSFTCAALSTHADLLALYNFNNATYADSAGYADVTASDLSKGAAQAVDSNFSTTSTPVDGGARSYFIRGAGLNIADNSTAVAATTAETQGQYFEITLNSIKPMFLTSLGFDTSKNAGNPHDFRVFVTSDITGLSYANRLTITAPIEAGASLPDVIQSNIAGNMSDASAGLGTDWGFGDNSLIDLSVPAFQGITSVTFRVYGFAINAPSFSNSDVLRFDNVLVHGTTVVPEPGAFSLALLGSALLGLFRQVRESAR